MVSEKNHDHKRQNQKKYFGRRDRITDTEAKRQQKEKKKLLWKKENNHHKNRNCDQRKRTNFIGFKISSWQDS